MISDNELSAIASVDQRSIAEQYCNALKIPIEKIEEIMEPLLQNQEMATELLKYRLFDKTSCKWKQPVDKVWISGCNKLFVTSERRLREGGVNFCPFCGHTLEVVNDK